MDTTKKKTARKKKRASKPSCNCLEQVQEQLKAKGARLETSFGINFATGEITTCGPWLKVVRHGEGRKKLPNVLCTYCPFCGKKKS